MKLDYGSSSLVILGGWNPNIFTPTWFDKYFPRQQDVDNLQGDETNLEIAPGTVFSIKHAPIKVPLSNGVIIIFTEGKLDCRLNENIKDFYLLEQTVLKLFQHLSTTLAIGYGANFVFKSDNIDQKTIDVIHKNGIMQNKYFDNQIIFENYLFRIDVDSINTNIGIKVNNIDSNCVFDVNFHFNINDLLEFELKITENPICDLKQRAIKVMSDVYKLDVEV